MEYTLVDFGNVPQKAVHVHGMHYLRFTGYHSDWSAPERIDKITCVQVLQHLT